jgi:hypothetical protein
MRQLTFQDIVDMDPCSKHSPDKYTPKTWKGTILDILKLPNVGPAERLWVAYRVLDDEVLRLFAVACARRALGRVSKPDIRSLIAVNMAEAFTHGRATAEEMKVAHRDAYAAAADAAAADTAYAYAAAAAAADTAYAYAAADVAADAAAADAAAAAAYAYAAADVAAAATAAAREKERTQQIEDLIELIKGGSV